MGNATGYKVITSGITCTKSIGGKSIAFKCNGTVH